ncbi:MAG: sigma-70 family RNA polymerase sigma factor [Actinomycetota bacterium]|jgi:RNA polymerase primary sigma factor
MAVKAAGLPSGGGEEHLVRVYLDEIGRVPLLTRDEEKHLGQAVQRGLQAARALEQVGDGLDGAARRRLEEAAAVGQRSARRFVEANLRLVVSVAKKYSGASSLSLLDLVQEGNLGLMHAVERFDPGRGFRFSTYATWWVRQAITRAIANCGRTIRLPVRTGALLSRARKAQATIEAEAGRAPTREELADELGVTPGAVDDLLCVPAAVASIFDRVGGHEEGSELADMLADPQPSPFDRLSEDMLPVQVRDLLATLNERERRVVMLRYGLDRGRPRTLEEVGQVFRLSREQVRQIERRALAKLRSRSTAAEARDLLAG